MKWPVLFSLPNLLNMGILWTLCLIWSHFLSIFARLSNYGVPSGPSVEYYGNRSLICIITGASSGIGFHLSQRLAACGYYVIMACRDMRKGEEAASSILSSLPAAALRVMHLDTSSPPSILAFVTAIKIMLLSHNVTSSRMNRMNSSMNGATKIRRTVLPGTEQNGIEQRQEDGQGGEGDQPALRLHLLVNNAGIFAATERRIPETGMESCYATNFLGPCLLTLLLLPLMDEAKQKKQKKKQQKEEKEEEVEEAPQHEVEEKEKKNEHGGQRKELYQYSLHGSPPPPSAPVSVSPADTLCQDINCTGTSNTHSWSSSTAFATKAATPRSAATEIISDTFGEGSACGIRNRWLVGKGGGNNNNRERHTCDWCTNKGMCEPEAGSISKCSGRRPTKSDPPGDSNGSRLQQGYNGGRLPLCTSPPPSRVIFINSFTHRAVTVAQLDANISHLSDAVKGEGAEFRAPAPSTPASSSSSPSPSVSGLPLPFSPSLQYQMSKVLLLLFAYGCNHRMRSPHQHPDSAVQFISYDPGFSSTHILRELPSWIQAIVRLGFSLLRLLKKPEEVAAAIARLVQSQQQDFSGAYFFGLHPHPISSSQLSLDRRRVACLYKSLVELLQLWMPEAFRMGFPGLLE